MKTHYLLTTLCLLLFLTPGCVNDQSDMPTPDPTEENLVDIGSYELLAESLATIPYKDHSRVVFIDSLSNELILEIGGLGLLSFDSLRWFPYGIGLDTVHYLYATQFHSTFLRNDAMDLQFSCSLTARPYEPDPESRYIADLYTIYCQIPDTNPSIASQVFYDVVDQRSWPTASPADVIGDVEIFGRVFSDVRMNDLQDPKSKVLFNYEYGIVSFTDHDGVRWRFERFE